MYFDLFNTVYSASFAKERTLPSLHYLFHLDLLHQCPRGETDGDSSRLEPRLSSSFISYLDIKKTRKNSIRMEVAARMELVKSLRHDLKTMLLLEILMHTESFTECGPESVRVFKAYIFYTQPRFKCRFRGSS